jgi:Cu(I)/Ag(I) efflux system membrane fusion protein
MNAYKFMHFVACLVVAVLALLVVPGCDKQSGGKGKASGVDYYTCTMHPSVKSQDSKAKCPICAMDLVPVMKKGSGGAHDHGAMQAAPAASGPETSEFTVPVKRQQQIGVTYAAATRQPMHHTVRSVGYIVPDKARHWEFVARVEGYVEKLHVTSPGELVEEGQPLLTIYSPDLLATSRELITVLEARDRANSPEARASAQRLIDAARFRLEQWNVTAKQIVELEKTRKPTEFLVLYSPFKGVVEDVQTDQGRRVMTGDHLVDVADLSIVWAWAEFYEDELPMLKKGLKVTLTSRSYPGEKFEGEIALINPFLDEMKRTGKVRIDIPNPELRVRPGMYVNIELGMDMGEALTIPVSAVMPTGGRALVFIEKSQGRLDPRFIELGQKYGDVYEVRSGLKEGERVVASANFLIDAESKVQGAVKNFEAEEKAKQIELPEAARPLLVPIVESYLAIEKLLAQDKFDDVAPPAEQLRTQAARLAEAEIKVDEQAEAYRERVHALHEATGKFKPANLEESRMQFGHVSAALIALVTHFAVPLDRELRVAYCPMWEKSPGRWLQTGSEIENPFMGQAMLKCGSIEHTIPAAK